jgi:hypothetical protein
VRSSTILTCKWFAFILSQPFIWSIHTIFCESAEEY